MTYRQSFRKSRLAFWGFRLSIISAHIVVFTIILHRYASQSTAVSLNLLQIGFIGAFTALVISLIACVQIWKRLLSGFGKAIAGAFISLMVLAWPLSQLPVYFTAPQNYDVTTDLKDPPAFGITLSQREFGSNETNFIEREPFSDQVRPLRFYKSGQDAFDLVRQLVLKRKWEIITIRPPGSDSRTGIIEAVDLSPILSAADDIVIRITSRGGQSILDMRSQSRYGSFDLGRNEDSIIKFMDDLISQNKDVVRVAEGEPRFLSKPKKKLGTAKATSPKP